MRLRTAPITEIMARVIDAGRLDEATWENELKPLLEAQPRQAGFEIRRLLILASSDRYEIPRTLSYEVNRTLRDFGYPGDLPGVAGERKGAKASERFLSAVAENVTEASPTFDALRALVAPDAADVTIAVLDTTVDLTHPALAGSISPALEAVNRALDAVAPVRDGGRATHGTPVSAIALRGTDHLKLLPQPIIDDAGNLLAPGETIDAVIAGGARVVNLSIGTTSAAEVEVLEAAILRHPETLFVLAAGNGHARLGSQGYPPETTIAARDYPNVQVVTSTTREHTLPPRSAFGADLAALGESVRSASPVARPTDPLYFTASGTSMAAPQVSSIAGRCLVLDATLDPVALGRLLDVTSDKSEHWDDLVKARGTVNAERACAVAAAAVLVRRGASAEAAVKRLPIPSREKPAVLAALTQFLGGR
ncbi:MAG: S8 family serine peptidase [Archangiaceae bacterium]|nr:S8 family serine peptidase [Archangiaceae bacterium]